MFRAVESLPLVIVPIHVRHEKLFNVIVGVSLSLLVKADVSELFVFFPLSIDACEIGIGDLKEHGMLPFLFEFRWYKMTMFAGNVD